LGIDPQGATAAVQGFGNVGRHAALELGHRGCKVIAVSDVAGAIADPNGLDIPALAEHSRRTGSVVGFPCGKAVDHRAVLCAKCDFLVPAALEECITAEIAPHVQARIVAEGANGPTTMAAAEILHTRGIPVVPDVLANGGGVTVSYFEWVQNRQEYYWSREEVISRLTERMVNAYREIADRARERCGTLRQAAYEIAMDRVVRVTLERGAQ